MKKILVTGGNGFVGKAVVKLLRESNYLVQVWDRKKDGSVLDGSSRLRILNSGEFQTVIHLAWNSISDKNYDRNMLNIEFAKETIKFRSEILSRGMEFVSIGSFFEGIPVKTENLYQKSKMEIATRFMEDSFHNTIWFKPTYIFSFSALRPRVINAIANDPSFQIQYPENNCDWIEVRDVASAVEYSLQYNQRGRINLSSGINLNVKDFTRKFMQLSVLYKNLENLDGNLQNGRKIDVHHDFNQTNMSSSAITKQYLTIL